MPKFFNRHLSKKLSYIPDSVWIVLVAITIPVWLAFWFRELTGIEASWIGIADDLAFCGLAASIGIAIILLPRLLRNAFALVFFVGICVLYIADYLHFTFFKTFINIHTIQTADQLGAAKSSVFQLLTPASVITFLLIPMVIALFFFRKPQIEKRHTLLGLVLFALVLGSGGLAFSSGSKSEFFVPAENNPMMYIVRHWTQEYVEASLGDDEANKAYLLAHADKIYNNLRSGEYKSAGNVEYPLAKVPVHPQVYDSAKLKNVVIILGESIRAFELGLTAADPKSPIGIGSELRKLAKESLYFPNFYSNGTQTVRGEVATLCSVLPNFSGGQIYSTYADLDINCLPQVLKDIGYSTHWISGYTANYGNKRTFLSHHGIEQIHDGEAMKNYKTKYPKIGWGPSDLDTFDFALQTLDEAKRPFMAEIMTLSNHHPFHNDYGIEPPELPVSWKSAQHYSDYVRGLNFTDYAMGHFIRKAREKPWYKDTVFVFLGDHGIWTFPKMPNLHPVQKLEAYFRQGLVIHAPFMKSPRVVEAVGSQIDVAPTILDIIGVKAPQAFTGTSLLDETVPKDDRFAVLENENSWHIRQGNDYCYALGTSCFKKMYPACKKGEEPRPVGHSCFEGPANLLTLDLDVRSFKSLGSKKQKELLNRGKMLVEFNKLLLRENAFYPKGKSIEKLSTRLESEKDKVSIR